MILNVKCHQVDQGFPSVNRFVESHGAQRSIWYMRGGIISMNFIEWHELRHGIKPTDTLIYYFLNIYIYICKYTVFFQTWGGCTQLTFTDFRCFEATKQLTQLMCWAFSSSVHFFQRRGWMPTLVSELAGVHQWCFCDQLPLAAFLLRYIGTCNEQVALDVGKLTLKSIEHSSMFVASAKVCSEWLWTTCRFTLQSVGWCNISIVRERKTVASLSIFIPILIVHITLATIIIWWML